MKKILIISNNPLSRTNNNGKTILNMLEQLSIEDCELAQVYITQEYPTIPGVDYYRVTDRDILHFKKGQIVKPNNKQMLEKKIETKSREILPIHRFLRDIIWNSPFTRNVKLEMFIQDFSPETVLFVAGDFSYFYNLVLKMKGILKFDLVTFTTDDYITEYNDDDMLTKMRKRSLSLKLEKVINISEELIVISKKMKKYYDEIFGADSTVFHNVPFVKSIEKNDKLTKDKFIITYAGSLHSGRLQEIRKLCSFVENDDFLKKNIQFNIFTHSQGLEKSEILNVCKPIQEQELYLEYAKSNALLFVESTDLSNIEKTRFSFSTKIIEYLQMRKPILLIGNVESYSIEYLSSVSLFLNFEKKSETIEQFYNLIRSESLQEKLGCEAKELYDRDYIEGRFINKFREKIQTFF